MTNKQVLHTKGFTIVELLIVIVVIGILAAITIVAFNGVSNRAKVAAIQSDLANSNKKLKLAFATDNVYPATVAAAGLTPSNGNSFQYTVDNTATPATFCLTTTNGTNSYYVTQDTTASTIGTCPGHTNPAGPTITNLATNPSMETNLTGWSYWAGSNGTAAASNIQTGGFVGQKYGRLTWSVATTSPSGGPSYNAPVTANKTYTASLMVRTQKTQVVYMEMKYLDSGGATITPTAVNPTPVTLNANAWTTISYSSTAPSNAASVTVGVYTKNTTGASNWNVNDYIDYDGAMLTQGSTLYSFADGNSTFNGTANWSWAGTVNNSTSTGPGAVAQ